MQKSITIQVDLEILNNMERISTQNNQTLSKSFEHAALIYIMKSTESRIKDSATPSGQKKIESSLSIEPMLDESHTGHRKRMTVQYEKKVLGDFIDFLKDYLERNDKKYVWKYTINQESYVKWADPSYYAGETLEDSERLFRLCREKILESIKKGDAQLCFEAIRLAMDWGGTFYNFKKGPQRGNETAICKLYREGMLLQIVKLNYERIQSDDIENLDYYTSGWAVVWYILAPEKMIIMGAREVYALNRIILEFKEKFEIERVPQLLNIGQLVYKDNKRYIEGIKYVYTNKGKLKMLAKILQIIKLLQKSGVQLSTHEIDQKFFMIGQ